MSIFIKLLGHLKGQVVYVNPKNVELINNIEGKSGSTLHMVSGEKILIGETPQDVAKKLTKEKTS